MLENLFRQFSAYASEGMMTAIGMDPRRATAGGGMRYHGWNMLMDRAGGEYVPQPSKQIATKGMAKWGSIAGSGAALGFGAYGVIHGYNENGLAGAKDAAVWEVATMAATTRFAYGAIGSAGPAGGLGPLGGAFSSARMASLGIKPAGSVIKFGGGGGMMAGIARGGGAAIGATMGQAVLGTPGAFMGAYIGAAPIRFAATHPLLALGAVGAGAVASGGYMAGAVIKGGLNMGYQHRQRQKGINTSGSMAAFMTSGAQTMRSRAVQAIHKSHLNARSALGQEAGFMHMPGKNYHSRYR